MMRKSFLLWIGALALSLVAFKEANSSQPPLARTGAPGEGTCAGCHSGASPVPSIALTHNGQPLTTYVPGGASMTLTLTVSHPTLNRYGFQLTALSAQSSQQNAPNQGLSVGSHAGIVLQTSAGGRRYIAHQGTSSTGVWTFDWTPPASDVGPITWYIAANAVNGNGGTSGDAPGTFTLTLSPDQTATLYAPIVLRSGVLYLPPDTEVTLFTLGGQKVGHFYGATADEVRLSPGVYIVRWQNVRGSGFQKLWIGE